MQLLKQGSTGVDVKIIQRQLLSTGYQLDLTGSYDSATVAAVRTFQKKNNLTIDGMVGNGTSAILDNLAPIVVDISHNDGKIDWKNRDLRVKAVFAKATQGKSFVDPLFISDIANARACGLFVGAYHFLTAADTAPEQAANFIAALKSAGILVSINGVWSLIKGCMPLMVDVEDQVPAALNSLITSNKSAFVQKVRDFIAIVKKETGSTTMVLYSYKNFFAEYLNNAVFDADLWLASYQIHNPALPSGYVISKLKMWQFGETIYPPGFPSCDIDIYQGTLADLAKWANAA